jgi:hypothetical protein
MSADQLVWSKPVAPFANFVLDERALLCQRALLSNAAGGVTVLTSQTINGVCHAEAADTHPYSLCVRGLCVAQLVGSPSPRGRGGGAEERGGDEKGRGRTSCDGVASRGLGRCSSNGLKLGLHPLNWLRRPSGGGRRAGVRGGGGAGAGAVARGACACARGLQACAHTAPFAVRKLGAGI